MTVYRQQDNSRRTARIDSLDALRGVAVLLWLLSAGLGPVLHQLPRGRLTETLAAQFAPSFWRGLTAYDLSLPLFLFVAGASIVPAFNKRHAAGQTTRQVIWRIIWRTVLLCTVGIVCEDGKWLHWHDPRLVGAFQRIAVCYALAGVLKLTTRWRFQAVAVGFLLIDYWGILAFGIPGEASPYSLEGNAAAVVDQLLLPGRK